MSCRILNPAQTKAMRALDKALLNIAKEGLALRVYDGTILVIVEADIEDPRYGVGGKDGSDWINECAFEVGRGVGADGGAGV